MISGIKCGDTLAIGSYVQNRGTEPEPVKWIVLDLDDSKALLLSLRVLDAVNYHTQNVEITWENSEIRKWCNTAFYCSAFSEAERKFILSSRLDNEDAYDVTVPGKEYHPFPGVTTHEIVPSRVESADTTDRVFFLSVQECRRYHNLLNAFMPEATEYAKAKGALTTTVSAVDPDDGVYRESPEQYSCFWWLRTRAEFGSHAAVCDHVGKVYPAGSMVYLGECCGVGVRPAVWIDLGRYEAAGLQEE